MTTIAQARTGLATAVAVTGLHGEAYETDNIIAPGFQIARGAMDPRLVMSNEPQEYVFKVKVYFPKTAEINAQIKLDEHCAMTGSGSVRAQLENDANYTANTFHYVEVVGVSETFAVQRESGEFLMVEFDVRTVF
jgi:hypothetical protein